MWAVSMYCYLVAAAVAAPVLTAAEVVVAVVATWPTLY